MQQALLSRVLGFFICIPGRRSLCAQARVGENGKEEGRVGEAHALQRALVGNLTHRIDALEVAPHDRALAGGGLQLVSSNLVGEGHSAQQVKRLPGVLLNFPPHLFEVSHIELLHATILDRSRHRGNSCRCRPSPVCLRKATECCLMPRILTKNVREKAAPGDGCRVLVMTLWPRGVRKSAVDVWFRELGTPRPLIRGWKSGRLS